MKRLLISLILCLAAGAFGSVPVDVAITWEGHARGTLANQTGLAPGTFGDQSGWESGTFTRWTFIAPPGNYQFPVSVTVTNKTFTGSSSNWLSCISYSTGSQDWLYLDLSPNYTQKTNFVLAGFVQFNATGSSSTYWDTVYVTTDSSDYWGVMQAQSAGDGSVWYVESHSAKSDGSSDYGSLHLSEITGVVGGHVYYYQLYWKATAGTNYVRIYDPDNGYAKVGESYSLIGTTKPNPHRMAWLSGYLEDYPGSRAWGPAVVLYNPTDATVDGLLTNTTAQASQPVTAINVGTLRIIGK